MRKIRSKRISKSLKRKRKSRTKRGSQRRLRRSTIKRGRKKTRRKKTRRKKTRRKTSKRMIGGAGGEEQLRLAFSESPTATMMMREYVKAEEDDRRAGVVKRGMSFIDLTLDKKARVQRKVTKLTNQQEEARAAWEKATAAWEKAERQLEKDRRALEVATSAADVAKAAAARHAAEEAGEPPIDEKMFKTFSAIFEKFGWGCLGKAKATAECPAGSNALGMARVQAGVEHKKEENSQATPGKPLFEMFSTLLAAGEEGEEQVKEIIRGLVKKKDWKLIVKSLVALQAIQESGDQALSTSANLTT